jgi:hypothetical protein
MERIVTDSHPNVSHDRFRCDPAVEPAPGDGILHGTFFIQAAHFIGKIGVIIPMPHHVEFRGIVLHAPSSSCR